jgi:hypothetical protein
VTSDRTTSLRSLARELGVQHSALSKAVREGRLTAGVTIEHGKVRVIDAAAAAEQWRRHVHVPRIDYRPAPAPPPTPAPPADLAIVLFDRAMDRRVTACELFAERDACSLLATAVVASALGNAVSVAALRERVAAQLRAVARLHGAGADDIARAERDLESTLAMLADQDEDDEEP